MSRFQKQPDVRALTIFTLHDGEVSGEHSPFDNVVSKLKRILLLCGSLIFFFSIVGTLPKKYF